MVSRSEEKLGTQPLLKLIFSLAIPAVLAQIVNLLYSIVDRIYIGHIADIGALALTGMGLCMPILLIVSAFAAFAGNGGAPLVRPGWRSWFFRQTWSEQRRKSPGGDSDAF